MPPGKYHGTARKSKGADGGSGGTYQFAFTVTGSHIQGITFSKVPMTCVDAGGAASAKAVTLPGGFPVTPIQNGFLLPVYLYRGGRWRLLAESATNDGSLPEVAFNLAYDLRPKHFAASVVVADLNIRARADANGTFDPRGALSCGAASDVTLTKR